MGELAVRFGAGVRGKEGLRVGGEGRACGNQCMRQEEDRVDGVGIGGGEPGMQAVAPRAADQDSSLSNRRGALTNQSAIDNNASSTFMPVSIGGDLRDDRGQFEVQNLPLNNPEGRNSVAQTDQPVSDRSVEARKLSPATAARPQWPPRHDNAMLRDSCGKILHRASHVYGEQSWQPDSTTHRLAEEAIHQLPEHGLSIRLRSRQRNIIALQGNLWILDAA